MPTSGLNCSDLNGLRKMRQERALETLEELKRQNGAAEMAIWIEWRLKIIFEAALTKRCCKDLRSADLQSA
jgi:hypothetical protein